MGEMMKIVQERHSSRGQFDPTRPVPKDKLTRILEAARWTPTAHNMQNYEIIIIDDKKVIETIGNIKSMPSEEFIREKLRANVPVRRGTPKKENRHPRQPVPAKMERRFQTR